jgi:NAD(P)-dependent dehydrogenase (short-subunit alcohol dehydrogenase family)
MRKLMSEYEQRVAIITGASQGIGAGLVAEYCRQGGAVIPNAPTIKASENSLNTLGGKLGCHSLTEDAAVIAEPLSARSGSLSLSPTLTSGPCWYTRQAAI